MNALHLILRGIPFGILFLVILELLKDKDAVSVSRLVALFIFMAVTMVFNIFFAVRVHVRGYISALDVYKRQAQSDCWQYNAGTSCKRVYGLSCPPQNAATAGTLGA